jgi:hypothetical protein
LPIDAARVDDRMLPIVAAVDADAVWPNDDRAVFNGTIGLVYKPAGFCAVLYGTRGIINGWTFAVSNGTVEPNDPLRCNDDRRLAAGELAVLTAKSVDFNDDRRLPVGELTVLTGNSLVEIRINSAVDSGWNDADLTSIGPAAAAAATGGVPVENRPVWYCETPFTANGAVDSNAGCGCDTTFVLPNSPIACVFACAFCSKAARNALPSWIPAINDDILS